MAAYGALVSLMHTINDIQHHPHPPISLAKQQTESLTENANFLKDFLMLKLNPLETRIAAASYAAEDVIESSIIDHILTKHNVSFPQESLHGHSTEAARNDVAAGSVDLYEDLQRVIDDMDSIKKEVMEIKQRHGAQHHQIMQLQSDSMISRSSSILQNTTMVGIGNVSNKLLYKLIGGNPNRQVIPITGMGGIGKTTLATNVYHKQNVVEHFDSQDCRMKETLLKLHQLDSSEMNEHELGEMLHQELSGRRYLIVMDAIWDIEVWDELQLYFPDNNNGSRIVLTTRLSKLAHEVSG